MNQPTFLPSLLSFICLFVLSFPSSRPWTQGLTHAVAPCTELHPQRFQCSLRGSSSLSLICLSRTVVHDFPFLTHIYPSSHSPLPPHTTHFFLVCQRVLMRKAERRGSWWRLHGWMPARVAPRFHSNQHSLMAQVSSQLFDFLCQAFPT